MKHKIWRWVERVRNLCQSAEANITYLLYCTLTNLTAPKVILSWREDEIDRRTVVHVLQVVIMRYNVYAMLQSLHSRRQLPQPKGP